MAKKKSASKKTGRRSAFADGEVVVVAASVREARAAADAVQTRHKLKTLPAATNRTPAGLGRFAKVTIIMATETKPWPGAWERQIAGAVDDFTVVSLDEALR